jgi:membrane protein insertase Oxa1/YidC/SpoIIIJ
MLQKMMNMMMMRLMQDHKHQHMVSFVPIDFASPKKLFFFLPHHNNSNRFMKATVCVQLFVTL